MKHRQFISQIDEPKVLEAIRAAEKNTSGEIRVFISHYECTDALTAAQRQFGRLAMHKTRHRNGILIFIAPKSQTFALVGDVGIHQKCGDDFWQALRDEMTSHLKAGEYTTALVHAITKAGKLLAQHFPPLQPHRHQ